MPHPAVTEGGLTVVYGPPPPVAQIGQDGGGGDEADLQPTQAPPASKRE